VIMNGLPVCSCLVLVSQAEDSDIITSEGLVKNGMLNAIQEAFIDHGAVQCGHCIPGMIVSASALLARKRRPTRQDIQDALSGNLCRCTGYTKIIASVEDAAKKTRP